MYMKILNSTHKSRNLSVNKYIKIMQVFNHHSSVVEASVLGYDTASLGNQIPSLRRNIMPSSPRVDKLWKN